MRQYNIVLRHKQLLQIAIADYGAFTITATATDYAPQTSPLVNVWGEANDSGFQNEQIDLKVKDLTHRGLAFDLLAPMGTISSTIVLTYFIFYLNMLRISLDRPKSNTWGL